MERKGKENEMEDKVSNRHQEMQLSELAMFINIGKQDKKHTTDYQTLKIENQRKNAKGAKFQFLKSISIPETITIVCHLFPI